tara:strand:- start:6561 stop:7322 length:762 start_codon:yes stop_codon:yes gene_type:complete
MLDYKELARNPHHLHKNSSGTFVGDLITGFRNTVDEVLRFDEWSVNDIDQWLSSWGTGSVSEEQEQAVKDQEKTIMDKMGQLKHDEFGTPVLSEFADTFERARADKERALTKAYAGGETDLDKAVSQLYKMGIQEHGAVTSKLRGATKLKQDELRGITSKFHETTGQIEDKAFQTLSDIEDAVMKYPSMLDIGQSDSAYREALKTIYEPGGAHEKKGVFEKFNVPTLGGQVNPEEEIQRAFEYDYRLGGRKRT